MSSRWINLLARVMLIVIAMDVDFEPGGAISWKVVEPLAHERNRQWRNGKRNGELQASLNAKNGQRSYKVCWYELVSIDLRKLESTRVYHKCFFLALSPSRTHTHWYQMKSRVYVNRIEDRVRAYRVDQCECDGDPKWQNWYFKTHDHHFVTTSIPVGAHP